MIAKPEDYSGLRTSGKILSEVLHEIAGLVRPGVTTAELDLAAEKAIRARGGVPSFLNYKARGASYGYPASLCASVNDQVVHAIPSEEMTLEEGDIISLDLGVNFEGYFTDSALTMTVGAPGKDDARLMEACREALKAGIKAAHVGGYTGDIGAAIEAVAKQYGVSIAEDLGGHATGRGVHEKPYIGNEGKKGEGEKLTEGLVIAIEPIFSLGGSHIALDADGWTYRMADGARAAHFEQTIILTKDGPEILTPLKAIA